MIRNFKDKTGKHSPVVLLPGGGVDEGENAEQSLMREVQEELGVSLVKLALLCNYKDTRPMTPSEKTIWAGGTIVENLFDFYSARIKNNAKPVLKEPEKFDAMEWIHPNEIGRFAERFHAPIGDGINEAVGLLTPAATPAFVKW